MSRVSRFRQEIDRDIEVMGLTLEQANEYSLRMHKSTAYALAELSDAWDALKHALKTAVLS
jgi:hypothetical protein